MKVEKESGKRESLESQESLEGVLKSGAKEGCQCGWITRLGKVGDLALLSLNGNGGINHLHRTLTTFRYLNS